MVGSPPDRGSGWPIGVSAHPHPPIAPTPTHPKVYLLQEHPGLRGTPLAMLAAQCNKLSSMSPPPLADAAVGKGFHPWKKGGGSPEQAASVSRQGATQSTPTSSNQPGSTAGSTFSTSPQQATSPSPAYGELLLLIMISVHGHFLSEYARSRYIATADAAGVMLNTSIIQIPAVEFFHGSGTPTYHGCGQTCHDGCAARDRSPSPHPGPPPTRQIIRWPRAPPRRNFHVFTPNGRKSSRQLTSINRLPDFNRWPRTASPAPRLQQQETRPVSSPQLTRHSAPATASFSDRVCARNPHILYLPVSHPPQ